MDQALYPVVVCAVVMLNRDEFTADQLRNRLNELTDQQLNQPRINNFLKRLVSEGGNTILVRKAKGGYRFADPRMPSYIRIASKETIFLERFQSETA